MTDAISLMTDVLSEVETLPLAAVALTPEQIDGAANLSDRAIHAHQRWQVYLNGLALLGFAAWLQQRPTDIRLNVQACTILESASIDGATAVCNLSANGFKLCLIATGTLLEDEILIPKAAIDAPDLNAHFYVPIEVYEEQATDADYLYTRVIGTPEEQLFVTLSLNGDSLTLPPFAFQ